jgi:hypothetical protein
VPKTLDSERAREIGLVGARAKKVAAIERRIRELVDAAPPLSDEQRDRLAVLLRGGGAAA